jgi:hypothetical protein
MERQKFDDSWKEAFEDAELSPSENLWTNIELDLEKAEGKKMKKRILYFKLMAAASIAFAMTFAGVGYFYMDTRQNHMVADNTSKNNSAKESSEGVEINKANPATANVEASSATSGNGNSATSGNGNSATEVPSAQERANTSEQIASSNETTTSDADLNITKQVQGIAKATDNNNRQANDDRGVDRAKLNAGNSDLETSGTEKQIAENLQNKTKSTISSSDNGRQNGLAKANSDRMFDSANEVVAANQDENKRPGVAATREAGTGDERMVAVAKLPEIVHVRKPAYQPEQTAVDPVKAMLDRLAAEEQKYASNKKTKTQEDKRSKKGSEKLWTSVGIAAGSFNSVVSNASNSAVNSNLISYSSSAALDASSSISNDIVREQSDASGISYVIGLSLGGKLSERWILQGGVNYMTQSSDYTANAVVGSSPERSHLDFSAPIQYTDFKVGSINELSNAGKSDQLVNTASYNVNSNMRYVSVPLQAGYLIVNRDFGLQLNAGVSTDLFIQNTLTPEEGSLQETTQGPGDESPYRTVNFSGIVGTELSYRFGQHYRIAVNPGLRYPFSSIYKSEIAVEAMPLTFDVGLRFRYIFN